MTRYARWLLPGMMVLAPIADADAQVVAAPVREVGGVCRGTPGLLAEPDGTSRVVSRLAFGEQVTLLGEVVSGTTFFDRPAEFRRMRRSNGEEGLVGAELCIPGAPAAVTKHAFLYRRPDLLTVTDQRLARMEPVAVVQTEGQWVKVSTIRSARGRGGWVPKESITLDAADVVVAKLAWQALRKPDEITQLAAPQAVVDSTELRSATLYEYVRELAAARVGVAAALGMASQIRSGALCLSIPASAVTPGTVVTLVFVPGTRSDSSWSPQVTEVEILGGHDEQCSHDLDARAYDARFSGPLSHPSQLRFAGVFPANRVTIHGRRVYGDVDGDGIPEVFVATDMEHSGSEYEVVSQEPHGDRILLSRFFTYGR